MKQFSLLLLIGVMSWLAWHLGTPEPVRPGKLLGIPQQQSQPFNATEARQTIQRAAMQSEQFLARSANTLKKDSIEVVKEVRQREVKVGHAKPKSNRSHEALIQAEPDVSAESSALDKIGHAAAQIWIGIQPLANMAWGAVQSGWNRLTTDHSLINRLPPEQHQSQIRHRTEVTDSRAKSY